MQNLIDWHYDSFFDRVEVILRQWFRSGLFQVATKCNEEAISGRYISAMNKTCETVIDYSIISQTFSNSVVSKLMAQSPDYGYENKSDDEVNKEF